MTVRELLNARRPITPLSFEEGVAGDVQGRKALDEKLWGAFCALQETLRRHGLDLEESEAVLTSLLSSVRRQARKEER